MSKPRLLRPRAPSGFHPQHYLATDDDALGGSNNPHSEFSHKRVLCGVLLPGFPWRCHAVVPYQVLYGINTMVLPHDNVACHSTALALSTVVALAAPGQFMTAIIASLVEGGIRHEGGRWALTRFLSSSGQLRICVVATPLSCSSD